LVGVKKLMKLAERQHAVFSRTQAVAFGVTPGELKGLLRRGTIERVVWGVYRVRGAPETWRQRLMIAVLAAGPGAAVSGRAAAALLGLPGFREGPVEITQLRRPSRRFHYGTEHSTTSLPGHHVRIVDGIPVTSIERTVFDLAGRRSAIATYHLIKALVHSKRTTIGKLSVVLAELSRGRPTKKLAAALAKAGDESSLTESELEDLVLAVLTAAGLPLPEPQVEVGGTSAPIGRLDFLYRLARLVIEADSKKQHGDNWFVTVNDQRRDKLLIAAGYQVIRTNWHELVTEPELLVNAVRAVLDRVGALAVDSAP
jgi:predicted transcriptional regulator of viral defense system